LADWNGNPKIPAGLLADRNHDLKSPAGTLADRNHDLKLPPHDIFNLLPMSAMKPEIESLDPKTYLDKMPKPPHHRPRPQGV